MRTGRVSAGSVIDERANQPDTAHGARPGVLVLSSSLLTERMLLFSRFFTAMGRSAHVRVWSAARREQEAAPPGIERFPAVRPFREFPYNYLRRLNEFAWDAKLQPPSRTSMMRHVRQDRLAPGVRLLRLPARGVAALGLERRFEAVLERFLLTYDRSPEATERLGRDRPSVVVTTGPHRYEEPAVTAAARRLGIPTLALITSWDNLSTKNRMPFQHDGYLVWSEQMKRELHAFYPASRGVPVYVVGAPQFDVFFRPELRESRAQFCARHGLRADRPILLYVLGSPNFLKEHHGALAFAGRVARGDLGDVQLLVRPHPLFDNGEEARALERFGERVTVQRTGREGLPTSERSQSEADVVSWVNTFRHADVVINLSSTATVDAAICDRPVVNIDFDPEPGQPNAGLVHDINHRWTHFRPVAESGGVALVRDVDEMVAAVRAYLSDPALHRAQRRWIVEHVCGFADGRCGERLAAAIADFAARVEQRVERG